MGHSPVNDCGLPPRSNLFRIICRIQLLYRRSYYLPLYVLRPAHLDLGPPQPPSCEKLTVLIRPLLRLRDQHPGHMLDRPCRLIILHAGLATR